MAASPFFRMAGLWGLAAAAGCGGSSTGPTPEPEPAPTVKNLAGRVDRTVTVDGQNRSFVVYVGSSVGATATAPVVFMFHGSGQSGDQFYNISRWKEMADQNGLIAVFPDALIYCYKEDNNNDGDTNDQGERTVGSKWTSAVGGGLLEIPCTAADISQLTAGQRSQIDHPTADDANFVDAMITVLKSKYVIDAKRIYASGFSNGAQFVNRLAADRSQTFAALHVHAGSNRHAPVPGRALSLAGSLGNRDQHLVDALGIPAVPISANTLVQYPGLKAAYIQPALGQLQLADVSTYSEITVAGKKVGQWTFRTSTAGGSNTYTFSLVEDNDHAYPNGVNHPLVVAQPAWTFFQGERLP